MKVKTLIKLLQEFDENIDVHFLDSFNVTHSLVSLESRSLSRLDRKYLAFNLVPNGRLKKEHRESMESLVSFVKENGRREPSEHVKTIKLEKDD